MDRKIFLSVVMPAYNEEYNLRTGVLDSVYDYLAEQPYSWEIIFVNDGSSDKTLEIARTFSKKHANFKVLDEPHKGKAATVIAGILAASGEIILFTDTDQATPIDQVEKFFPKFKEGNDIVIGSRSGREGAPLIRKAMASGFSLLRNLVLRLPYKDTQCGFKAFKSGAAKKIFEKLKIFTQAPPGGAGFKGYETASGASVSAGFDLEVLYIARKLGLKVAEVPVDWHHKEGTKVNPIKDSWEGLRDLLRVRLNAIQGRYKI